MGFFKAYIRMLLDEGHTVDIICNEKDSKVPECYRAWGCRVYSHDCTRSPFSKDNFRAIGQIRRLAEENGYDIVHCHTPIASIMTRLACRKLRKKGLKVMYTAHGFHFYKGAPKLNWLLFYPFEKLCARFTDVLITINQEDYALARKSMKAGHIEYVPGVGVNAEAFANITVDRALKRREIGVPEDARLLLSVGELNENKNHALVMKAMAQIDDPQLHYAIAGTGPEKEALQQLASSLGIGDRLHLCGHRKDVAELCKASDLYVHPSFREGLPVALMEAKASGLPCLASNIRGCADLLTEGLFSPYDVAELAALLQSDVPAGSLEAHFTTDRINQKMKEIYYEATKERLHSAVECR